MNRKVLIIGAAILIILLVLGSILIFRGCGSGKEDPGMRQKNNTLTLARDYMNRGEYQRALDLLDRLIIDFGEDSSIRELREEILAAMRQDTEASRLADREKQDELTRTLGELGQSIQQTASRPIQTTVIQQPPAKQDTSAENAARTREEQEKNRRVRELIDRGIREMAQSQFTNARKSFEAALDIKPDTAEAYAQMAESYFQEDNTNAPSLQKALENANKAVALDPNLWIPHNTLGKIFAETRNYPEAISEFNIAARLNPEDYLIPFELGKVQFRARMFPDAARSFERSTHLNARFDRGYFNLGVTLERTGDQAGALTAYRNAARVNPQYATAHFAVAE